MYDYFQDFPEENPANWLNGKYDPPSAELKRKQEEKIAKDCAIFRKKIKDKIEKHAPKGDLMQKKIKNTNWAFIDYENVGTLEGINFDSYKRILIFCGPKNTKLNLGSTVTSNLLKLEIIKLKTSGANNLDFHIAYYLGILALEAEQSIEFHIITKDNGYNGLISHINKSGRKCKKITIAPKIKSPPKPKPVKKIVNLSTCAELAIKRLKVIDGRKRPRKQDKLENWINSQCKTTVSNLNPSAIFNELVKAGKIHHSTAGIKYTL